VRHKHDATLSFYSSSISRSPVDSILTLMTVWSIWGKVIRTAIIVSYICTLWIGSSYNFTL